jgi:hypothetical protein
MANILIEIDRGFGWQVRNEGFCEATTDQVAAQLACYTVGNHRAFIDGILVASSEQRRNGRIVVTRHDI